MSNRIFIFLMATFLWIGFVCAISFMEAWLKFRAPGVTVPIGLSIGRVVFSALNNVEWSLSLVMGAIILIDKNEQNFLTKFWFTAAFIILVIQTLWLLPFLDKRASVFIIEKRLSPSSLHFYFIVAEILKVFALFMLSTGVFKLRQQQKPINYEFLID